MKNLKGLPFEVASLVRAIESKRHVAHQLQHDARRNDLVETKRALDQLLQGEPVDGTPAT